MARPLRIEYPGAWYHVMNRVAGRRMALREAWCERVFTELLADIRERFGVQCHAWCLMGNHYHLLLHTPQANLSRAMRHFNGLFTQRHNRHSRRDGPLFRGRYRAIVVEADAYLLALSRYIHRNPIEAGLVERLETYRASSYRAYLNRQRAPAWLETGMVLGMMGGDVRRQRYRQYVEQAGADEVSTFYANTRPGVILGSEAFRDKLLRGRKPDREQPQSRQPRRVPNTKEVLQAVSTAFDVPISALCHTSRGRGQRNIPRAVAMYLLQIVGQKKLGEIAPVFHIGHYATVSVTVRRLREELATDRKLKKQVQRITNALA